MKPKRQVLFIAYNFPPHGGPGVHRSVRFVKRLPQLGWRPLVISATPEASYVQDPTLLDEIPYDTLVERFPGFSIPPLYRAARKYGLQRAVVLANVLLQFPDAVRFWATSVRSDVLKVAQRERPDVIYTTSGPYSAHLLGMWLKRQTGLPWLADFRDPWSKNLVAPYPPAYRWLNGRLEKKVLTAADRVACVSEPWVAQLQQRLGRDASKFFVLPNAYDEDSVRPTPRRPPDDRFTIVHYGSFYRNRRPDQVVNAVRELVRSNRIPAERLRAVFIGRNARHAIPDEPPFERLDYLPHNELDVHRETSDALLLILATSHDNMGNYSGKIFEYIASNRPILAVVPPGGVAEELIRKTRTGLTTDGDTSAIADAIETLYLQWEDSSLSWSPDWDVIRRYTSMKTTQRLVEEFESMLQQRSP